MVVLKCKLRLKMLLIILCMIKYMKIMTKGEKNEDAKRFNNN